MENGVPSINEVRLNSHHNCTLPLFGRGHMLIGLTGKLVIARAGGSFIKQIIQLNLKRTQGDISAQMCQKKKRASLECGWVGEVWKDGGGVRIGGVEKQIPNFLFTNFLVCWSCFIPYPWPITARLTVCLGISQI